MQLNKLTPEEEDVIIHKGTNLPTAENMMIFLLRAHICAAAAMLPCILPMPNFTPIAAGRVLTRKFLAPLNAYLTRMVSAWKSPVITAALIWGMFLPENTTRPKILVTV